MHLMNDPADFPAELLEGFVEANPRHVRGVPGGAVRATKSPKGKVSFLVGGGTGHYPAFAGWVGPGFADGVVCGNIFASPSAAQAYSVAKAADHGGGVLFAFGNYAGDVLHFGQACERLKAEGIDARALVVTDDIASAPKSDIASRRGIAGDMPVFRIASAAAEEGADIDEVVRVFTKANDRTRSFGVAFSGCTLPGASEPLFTVPEGKMGVGLGIHGEPGIDEVELGTADEVATLLVDGLLGDRPDGAASRVLAIVNGLGSCSYEELFVTYRSVARRLREADLEIVEAQVGEHATSLDMGGMSVTLVWLDEELQRYWFAPCDSPAFVRGGIEAEPLAESATEIVDLSVQVTTPGSAAGQAGARGVARGLSAVARMLSEHSKHLGDLDAVAGDGDHGTGMERGALAAQATVERLVADSAGVRTALVGAGDSWSDRAGGTSGALWGALLTAAGNALADDESPDARAQGRAVRAGLDAVQRIGEAGPRDKTMLDALIPMVEAFEQAAAGGDAAAAWRRAAEAGRPAAQATAELEPKVGRARPLASRSVGHADPGAVSVAMVAAVIAQVFDGDDSGSMTPIG